MVISLIQTFPQNRGKSVTFNTQNTTAGNSIIALIGTGANFDTTNVTDNNGNTYTEIVKNDTGVRRCAIWLANNITGGAKPTVTMTTGESDGDSHIIISEWDGNLEVDQTNRNDSVNVANHNGGDITTAHADTVVVLVTRLSNAFSVSSRSESYAQINVTSRVETQYQIYSSSITTDADWTSVDNEDAGNVIASFNEISASTEVDKDFTVDAILIQDDIDKTFIVDSILKKSDNDKTLTADAFLQVIDNDKEITIDAILKATQTKDFTVDAILKKDDNDKTFTTDALLQVIDNDKTFTVDAILKKSDNDKDFTVDAFIREVFTKEFTADAFVREVKDKTLTADAILKKSDNDKTFDADAILKQSDIDKTFTVDAFIRQVNDKTFDVDAILKKSDNDKTFTVDAILDAGAIDKTFTVDAILKKNDNDKTFDVDALLQVIDNDITFTVDSFLKKTQTIIFTADAWLEKVQKVTFTVDAILVPSFDKGGIQPRKVVKEYEFDIFAAVTKKGSKEIKIYSPVKIKREKRISIHLNIFKEIETSMNMFVVINHDKLWEILDAI